MGQIEASGTLSRSQFCKQRCGRHAPDRGTDLAARGSGFELSGPFLLLILIALLGCPVVVYFFFLFDFCP